MIPCGRSSFVSALFAEVYIGSSGLLLFVEQRLRSLDIRRSSGYFITHPVKAMRVVNLFFVSLWAVCLATKKPPPKTFANRPIFTPPEGTRVSYPRVVELSDGTILATCSWFNGVGKPYFPIYESKDGGWTWKHISNLTDEVNIHTGRPTRHYGMQTDYVSKG